MWVGAQRVACTHVGLGPVCVVHINIDRQCPSTGMSDAPSSVQMQHRVPLPVRYGMHCTAHREVWCVFHLCRWGQERARLRRQPAVSWAFVRYRYAQHRYGVFYREGGCVYRHSVMYDTHRICMQNVSYRGLGGCVYRYRHPPCKMHTATIRIASHTELCV